MTGGPLLTVSGEVLCFNFLFDLLVGMVCGDMDGSCVDIAVD